MRRFWPIFIGILSLAGCSDAQVIGQNLDDCDGDCGELTCCDNKCVDTGTDADNCGSCGNTCGKGEICADGRCTADKGEGDCTCPGGQGCDENGDCVDLCGEAVCKKSETCCGKKCVDTGTDADNCGSCGNTCGKGEICADGRCTADKGEGDCTCPGGQGCDENGDCVDLCGEAVCKKSETCCDNKCVDTGTDADNCGSCGNICPAGRAFCVGGVCAADCTPKSCEEMQKNCGETDDGCGNAISCGTCAEGQVCKDNQCAAECVPQSCQTLNFNCGETDDGCGGTLDCGQCTGIDVCVNHHCEPNACTPTTCQAEGKNCGTIDDGCGGTLDCGSCSGNDVCTKDNLCCTPKTCREYAENDHMFCGDYDNLCGGIISCDLCTGIDVCVKSRQECVPHGTPDPDPNPDPTPDVDPDPDPNTPVRDTYPKRKSIKGLQPDFQDFNNISGNAVHGVTFNLVWDYWQSTLTPGPCTGADVEYGGYCFGTGSEQVIQTIKAIKQYSDAGIVVTGIVYGVPAWARRSCAGNSVVAPMFCAPADGKGKDFGRFAGFLAHYFNGENGHGRVADFVIHNEVNSYKWFNPGCSNRDGCSLEKWTGVYAESYNAAYDAIKKEQKRAKVLISFDHYFGGKGPISVSAEAFLGKLIPKIGNRDWMIAFHSYPPNLLNPAFGADDYNNNGIISFGNIGILSGWLHKHYPSDPHAWEIMLTENGINANNANMYKKQQSQLCQAFRNVLGTPGITNFIYHRMKDHPDETKDGLAVGLHDTAGNPKTAWTTFAYANRSDVGAGWPSCGFEDLPYVRMTLYKKGAASWITTRQPPAGFSSAGKSWKILREPKPGTTLYYECRVGGQRGNHTMISSDPGCENQFNMGPLGYLYNTQAAGTVPVYRCFRNSDHYVSSDAGCEGGTMESLVGYAYP